ncbi:hypothetical protein M9Y10_038189 [Tritrichomonas musculus]|uniref:non-specific serine/threonine protein kinase n=1 Tax=Tritrichomonas musculus TaxID=1915356 RepID=A0ABR2K8Q2_9EUKA
MALKPRMQLGYFELESQIGEGGFGDVWKVISTEDNKAYAMKIEPHNSKRATLKFEAAILKKMSRSSQHFPHFIFEGSEDNNYFLVEELLGPNLSTVASHLPGGIVILPFLARLADEMLSCIEDFHKNGYIHRDIKPQNFVVRLDGDTPICLIDYGISKLYVNSSGKHLDAREFASAIGSPVYASSSTHNRIELSRRDDLISMAYAILALSQFSLPWISEQNVNEIGKMKEENKLSDLLGQISPQFRQVGEHIQQLGFADTPDYNLMHHLLRSGIPQSSSPFEWFDCKPEIPPEPIEPTPENAGAQPIHGSNDPTGFLYALCPYYKIQPKNNKCCIY